MKTTTYLAKLVTEVDEGLRQTHSPLVGLAEYIGREGMMKHTEEELRQIDALKREANDLFTEVCKLEERLEAFLNA